MASFSSSAFSTNSFSINAFDFGGVVPPPVPPATRPSGGYALPYDRRIEEEKESIAERRLELRRIEEELANAERLEEQRLLQAEVQASAERKAMIEASLQQEISALRMERMRLMRLIDDEEAMLILLLSLPFH